MANTYLTKTFGTAGNRKTWTYSAWFKIGNVSTGAKRLFTSYDGSTAINQSTISLGGGVDYAMQIYNAPSGSSSINLTTNRLFRDCNAWYHIVVAVDTTQATGSNRVKLYVNGVQETSFSTETYGSQNEDFFINSTNLHTIGRRQDNSQYFDGSMAHVHFIDGTAYDADTFGETDATTGIWKPKTAPSVTYGTNGFFLKFENSAAFGTDSSGNANNFTVNGTMTQNIDTPSNVFSTLNALQPISSISYSNGNLTFTNSSSNHRMVNSTLAVSSGKYYAEVKASTLGGNYPQIGIIDPDKFDNDDYLGSADGGYAYLSNGNKQYNNSATSFGDTYTTGDIIGIAVDLDNHKLYFAKNGTWQNSGDPTSGATGTGSAYDLVTNVSYSFAQSSIDGGTDPVYDWNFGNGYFGTTAVSSAQNPDDGIGIFEYDVPTGYRALCTKSINAQEYD
jgi:hypothetical protein